MKILNLILDRQNKLNSLIVDTAPSGAGEGISGVLLSLFNDSSEEAKLLAYQLELLNKAY